MLGPRSGTIRRCGLLEEVWPCWRRCGLLEEVWPCWRKCVTVGVGFKTLILAAWKESSVCLQNKV